MYTQTLKDGDTRFTSNLSPVTNKMSEKAAKNKVALGPV